MDLTWLPAFIGVAGGGVTYLLALWKDRKNEKRFLTKDAVEALTVMLNQTNTELASAKSDAAAAKQQETECRGQLRAMRLQANDDRQFIFDLQHRVHELEAKAT